MKRMILCLLLFLLPSAVAAQPKFPLGYKAPTPEVRAKLHAERAKLHGHRIAALAAASTPPAEFDAATMGWAGKPGDQSDCGSCFLCSTCKTATTALVKAGYGKIDLFSLSWQYGMDYPSGGYFGGCNGGNGTEVIDWMCKNGWYAEADPSQPASALYPAYQASVGAKRLPAGAKKYTPQDWLFITSDQSDKPATVAEMKAAIMTYGRVNIAIDASSNPQFMNYSGGVLKTLGNRIDHEVNYRGWSDAKNAFLLENQWAGWGGAKAANDSLAWVDYGAVGQCQDPFAVTAGALPPPPPPPPPTPAGELFDLTFNRAIKQKETVWFPAPTAIPKGSKLQVYPPGVVPSGPLGDPPFEELSPAKPAPVVPPVTPPVPMPPAADTALEKKLRAALETDQTPNKVAKAAVIARKCKEAADSARADPSATIGQFYAKLYSIYDDLPRLGKVILDDLKVDLLWNPDKEFDASTRALADLVLQKMAQAVRKVSNGANPEPQGWSSRFLPANAERYEPTKYTQAISVLNDRDSIRRVPVASLERKWHQSGGMEGFPDVESAKYRSLPSKPLEGIGNIAVLNHLGSYQNNRGLKREYPEASRFDDVLSYQGKVFEHRARTKQDGKWSSEVVYRDTSARPPGYTGLTVSCASCHDRAGSGGYATGLVPGSDGVISDPLPWHLVARR